MKIVKNILIGLVVLLVVLFFGRNMIIKSVVTNAATAITGFPLKIQKLDINLSKSFIEIRDIRLFNPSHYETKTLMAIPEIYLDYDLGSILDGSNHIKDFRFHLAEFNVVKNKDGKLNLDELKALVPEQQEGEAAPKKEKKKEDKEIRMQIDHVLLKIGTVRYVDYSRDNEPDEQVFKLNIDEEFEDIQSPNMLVGTIVVKALAKTTIASIANFDVKRLANSLTDVTKVVGTQAIKGVEKTAEMTKEGVKKASGTAKKALTTTKDTVKGATKNVKDTTKKLKGLIKKPFSD